MTSVILNRRTLLSGGTLLGLGALLAACGQQATNEASASAAASESPSASATPSTVRGYSGGSKTPSGEYRKADKYGPAQNVPKPSLPEEGYNEKSLEGYAKHLTHGSSGETTVSKLVTMQRHENSSRLISVPN